MVDKERMFMMYKVQIGAVISGFFVEDILTKLFNPLDNETKLSYISRAEDSVVEMLNTHYDKSRKAREGQLPLNIIDRDTEIELIQRAIKEVIKEIKTKHLT